MSIHTKITRRRFLATLGASVLSLALARLATLETTLRAFPPRADATDAPAYGQSSYGR